MIGLEIFNTFILLLLVVAATASLWVKDLLVSAVFLEFTVFLCAYLGGNGSSGCCIYRSNGGCRDKHGGISGNSLSFEEKIKRLMKILSIIPVLAIGGLLLWAAQDFPKWGDVESPASKSPVSSHFIGNTGVDTEVPNMVTAVLADYRGFDTMFETVVVFIAGMAVIAILKGSTKGVREEKTMKLKQNLT